MTGLKSNAKDFTAELDTLFLERSIPVYWLGILFFIFFSILDLLIHREYFFLFFTYRLSLAGFLLLCLGVLHFPTFRKYARQLMVVALIGASVTIGLMIIDLGGFVSGYYIGIVLVVAFVFSVLPMTTAQVVGLGLIMYLVYLGILLAAGFPVRKGDITFLINNSYFYFTLFIIVAVKSYDDMRIRKTIWEGRTKVRRLKEELSTYAGDLENVVRHRLEQIKDLEFRYSELYENIQDMVTVVDVEGKMRLFNRRCAEVFALRQDPVRKPSFFDLIAPEQRKELSDQLLQQFIHLRPFLGLELRVLTAEGDVWTVEMSGNWVNIDADTPGCQLVLRNITHRKEMEQQMLESSRLVDKSRRAAILGLAKLAEYRDWDTGAHLERIREYTGVLTKVLARKTGMRHLITPSFLEDITLSSVLHDIGKVGIPDAILLKPERLNETEFEEMKMHCVYGRDALAEAERVAGDVSFLSMGQDIALFHHEKWDGTGYPMGLSRGEIPLAARIVALADVYDALTSKRCYKRALSHEQATEIIRRNRGKQFDPDVVDAFLEQEEKFKQIRMEILLQ